jgi:hydroxymethylpyrimidine pyrophosphatase-like HAD family hydrolase
MQERGVEVTLCTGRLYSGVQAIVKRLGITAPVACADGGHIVHARDGRTLVHLPLPASVTGRILDRTASLGLACFAFCEDRVVHDASGEIYLRYVRGWSPHTACVQSVPDHVLRQAPKDTLGLVVIGAPAAIHAARHDFEAALASAAQVDSFPVGHPSLSESWVLLVHASGVSKGSAVRWIADYYGIPMGSVVAVGDWVNDIPMMLEAGRSFAMLQAPVEVKAAATDQLASDATSGGGIAEAAKRCGWL